LLDNCLTDYAHCHELLDSILDGFKHTCLVELYLALAVEGLKDPLYLVIEAILIMRLVPIVLAQEIGKRYPIAFDERQDHVIQE
jgi:hypothetical protein